jgi:O-antigen/teichoic acid export membrane protein
MSAGTFVRASPAAVATADTRVSTIAGPALWLFSSNLLYAACQWGTVVALAKLGAPSSLGHLGLALAVATPIVLITGFALRSYQATDVLRRYAFTDYLNLRLAANVLAAAIILAVGWLGGIERAAVAILIPITAAKIAEATSETCYGLAQRHERMRFVAISRMLRGAIGLGALVAVLAVTGSLAAGAWAMAGSWTVFLLLVDLRVARELEPILAKPDPAVLWRLARESAPLGAMHGVYAVTQSTPRYLLALAQGASAVGYYTALSAVGPAMAQLAAAVCQAAAPRLGWAASGDGSRYRALVLRLLGTALLAGALLVGGAILVGHRFLTLAYNESYAVYQGPFVLLVLAAALGVVSEVAYIAMVAARQLGLLLGVQCCGLLATALSGAIFVPMYGVGGAAVAAAFGGVGALVPATFILLGRRRAA